MIATRRKLLVSILEVLAVVLVLLDLVVYFGVLSPLKDRVQSEQKRHSESSASLAPEQSRVALLARYASELPTADTQVHEFLKKHVPSRQRGYSTATGLVSKLTEGSGVQLTGIGYKLEPAHKNPLEWLRLDVSVEGGFKSLLDFAHGLESADAFVVIRSFTLDLGEGPGLNLRLGADLYMTP
jgi:Tfp pilus assembly protein PilO